MLKEISENKFDLLIFIIEELKELYPLSVVIITALICSYIVLIQNLINVSNSAISSILFSNFYF